MFSAVFIGLVVIHFNTVSANGYPSTEENELVVKNLTISWIDKPPYVTSPPNGSLDNEAHGLFRDVLLRYMTIDCGYYAGVSYQVETLRVDSEYNMIELLMQNKVHVAAPIFEPRDNRRYNEFPFFKVTDYPGTDFITTDERANRMSVVLDAVLKSWPLLAVTVVLTAIAGVVMWALVGLSLCNQINLDGISNF